MKTTFEFFKKALGVNLKDNLESYFSPETLAETRAALFSAADQRWPNKGTLASQRSRIASLCEMAINLLHENASWRRGEDPRFIRARENIRIAIDQRFQSPSAFEKAVFGGNGKFVHHLLRKGHKYPGSHSAKMLKRLPALASALDFNLEQLRHALVDLSDAHRERQVTTNSFLYGLPQDKWPECLREAVEEVFRFHKGVKPDNDPLGRPKIRSKKSFWKTRKHDGVCPSQKNAIALLRSFYGYCILPASPSEVRKLVLARLEKASGRWTDEDLPTFDRWMTGEGRDPKEANISWLFEDDVVEKWLVWMADRRGGVSRTQSSYCAVLGGWTKPNGAITQSYKIASLVMGYPDLPKRPLTHIESETYDQRMREWRTICSTASRSFFALGDGFDSDKVVKKRRRIQKHDELLSQADPSEKLEILISRYARHEPTHLDRTSQSWLLWCRNMAICELMLSNPLRAMNICMLRPGTTNEGHLYRLADAYEIRFAKHEVKNPQQRKSEGYRAKVSARASAWLDFYLSVARPNWPMLPDGVDQIFLTDSGRPLRDQDLYKILVSISKRCLPEYEAINPHLWRHIIATGWLKRHPNDFVTVALILADKIETVLNEYAHLSDDFGVRRYHDELRKRSRGPRVPSDATSR